MKLPAHLRDRSRIWQRLLTTLAVLVVALGFPRSAAAHDPAGMAQKIIAVALIIHFFGSLALALGTSWLLKKQLGTPMGKSFGMIWALLFFGCLGSMAVVAWLNSFLPITDAMVIWSYPITGAALAGGCVALARWRRARQNAR